MSVYDRTSLVLKRTFDAPLNRVYAAWTDQVSRDRHIKGWAGCLDHLGSWLAN